MNEHVNYISDEELEQLILQVEQKELVSAPPDLMETVLEAAGFTSKIMEVKPKASKQKEFYAYCFRVITSVAAAVALVFLLPGMTDWMSEKPVPDKATIVTEVIPTKEDVLNDTGIVERIIRNTGWFSKTGSKNITGNNE